VKRGRVSQPCAAQCFFSTRRNIAWERGASQPCALVPRKPDSEIELITFAALALLDSDQHVLAVNVGGRLLRRRAGIIPLRGGGNLGNIRVEHADWLRQLIATRMVKDDRPPPPTWSQSVQGSAALSYEGWRRAPGSPAVPQAHAVRGLSSTAEPSSDKRLTRRFFCWSVKWRLKWSQPRS
jgi:hypothetical protein